MKQVRIPMTDLERVMTNLCNETLAWTDVCKEYPEQKTDPKDEWFIRNVCLIKK